MFTVKQIAITAAIVTTAAAAGYVAFRKFSKKEPAAPEAINPSIVTTQEVPEMNEETTPQNKPVQEPAAQAPKPAVKKTPVEVTSEKPQAAKATMHTAAYVAQKKEEARKGGGISQSTKDLLAKYSANTTNQ